MYTCKTSMCCSFLNYFTNISNGDEILTIQQANTIIFSVVYRHPSGNISSSSEFLDGHFKFIGETKLTANFGGDFNIDWLASYTQWMELLSFYHSYRLFNVCLSTYSYDTSK